MALAAGAFLTQILLKRLLYDIKKSTKRLDISCLGGFIVINGIFIAIIRSAIPLNLAITGILLFFNGLLVSGLFSSAGEADPTQKIRRLSPLYAADLLGGCIGAFVASLSAIPFLGLELTSIALIILACVSFILV